MAHDPKIRAKVRASYVQGNSLPVAASSQGISYPTARNWKEADKAAGNDWDVARQARRMTQSGLASMTTEVLEMMAEQFALTLHQLHAAEDIQPLQRADILLKLGDTYSKAMAAAARGNPKLDALSVVMDVLRELGAFVAHHYPDMRAQITEVLEAFGPHIVTKVSSAAARG